MKKPSFAIPRAALIIGLLVTLLGSLGGWCFGADANGKVTLAGAIATAVVGIGGSLVASALYVLYETYTRWQERRDVIDAFVRTFAVPGLSAIPPCFIVASQRSELQGVTEDGKRFTCKFPLSLHWADDVTCANAIQGLVLAAGGDFPELITPDTARLMRSHMQGPAVFFSIGLFSNPFTEEICSRENGGLQNLLRLTSNTKGECCVLTANSAGGDDYDVDANSDTTSVPASPETAEAVVLRTRDPQRHEIAYVVVGGHYGQGTLRLGSYLRRRWRELSLRCDSTSPAIALADRAYLARLVMHENGLGSGEVLVGRSFRENLKPA